MLFSSVATDACHTNNSPGGSSWVCLTWCALKAEENTPVCQQHPFPLGTNVCIRPFLSSLVWLSLTEEAACPCILSGWPRTLAGPWEEAWVALVWNSHGGPPRHLIWSDPHVTPGGFGTGGASEPCGPGENTEAQEIKASAKVLAGKRCRGQHLQLPPAQGHGSSHCRTRLGRAGADPRARGLPSGSYTLLAGRL